MRIHLRAVSWLPILGVLGILAFATRASCSADAALLPDLIRKQPYLIFRGDPTQMQVLWQLTGTAPASIAWGPDTTCALGSAPTAEYGTDHQHSYVIPDLVAGSRYYYKVLEGGATYRGSFTAAPDSASTALRFFAYGDTRTNTAAHDLVAGGMLSAIAADPGRQTLVLSVGDLVTDGNNENYWTTEFFNYTATNIRALVASMPYQSVRGNHEGSAVGYTKYFPYPYLGGCYWSFDYGPAHFLVMDQYTSYAAGSTQLAWIESDLASTDKPWKFICLHEPGWSAGGGHANNTSVQTLIQPLCLQYGVSIVFAGHNHYYARAVVDGVQHVTTGGGGAPLYNPVAGSLNVVASSASFHFCEVDIQGGTLNFKAIKTDGSILDSFALQEGTNAVGSGHGGSTGRAFPNPFHTETAIYWSPGGATDGRLLIQDATGRLVRSLSAAGSGPQSTRWDGTDERGRPVAAGMYYYRVIGAPAGTGGGSVLLIR
jgi:hypothetical protein